jgi:hypothetical protein
MFLKEESIKTCKNKSMPYLSITVLILVYLFWWDLGLNSGLCACKASTHKGVSTTLVMPPVNFALVGDGGFTKYLPGWP